MQTSLFEYSSGKHAKPIEPYVFRYKEKPLTVTSGEIRIRSSAEWKMPKIGGVDCFTVDPSLQKREGESGSYSGGGGHVVNVKHLALEIREQILRMLDEGAKPKDITIMRSPFAKQLYKDRVGKVILPEISEEEIHRIFEEEVKETYSIWIGYEKFNLDKPWNKQIIYPMVSWGRMLSKTSRQVYIDTLVCLRADRKAIVF